MTEREEKVRAEYWAKWFIETKMKCKWSLDDIDEGLMIAWFANAMMAMHDHLLSEIEKTTEE